MLNKKIIIHVMAFLLLIEGAFMLISFGFSVYYNESDMWALGVSSGICFLVGSILWFLTKNAEKNIKKRDGYVIVSLVWIIFSFFGSLPFILSEAIPSFTNAFFETMSGFTTTGASILNDIEALPHGLLFWRSITQWLGGMGIIVLSLAILPIFGIGGMQLFIAEVPGPTPDKLHPRIKETAQRLWYIYILFTLAETLLLKFGGMEFFDAICHSFTTMATGGYS
ncbi:MAG: potassium transporter TrkG, partial [Bacteroidota bacterium]|nr:potassium transporter TrkG [Bacteroidota bacterium]